MKLTAKVKLQPTKEQADLLKTTLETANAACNQISQQAWDTQTFGQFSLHKITYHAIREQFGLAAQGSRGGQIPPLNCRKSRLLRKSAGKRSDGLGIHPRRIPLLQYVEIDRPRRPCLTALPAISFEIVRCRGERVRGTVDQVTVAVAIYIDSKLQI